MSGGFSKDGKDDVNSETLGSEQETTAVLAKPKASIVMQPEPHYLQYKWTYWYLNDKRDMNWENRLKNITTFGTVEQFWGLYLNIRSPSLLHYTCDYSVFKEGIQPMWEVPENTNGGRWLITWNAFNGHYNLFIRQMKLRSNFFYAEGKDEVFSVANGLRFIYNKNKVLRERWSLIDKMRHSDLLDTIWLEVLLAVIGGQFGEYTKDICGIVVNIRSKGSKISIWTTNANNDESNMHIGETLKKTLTNPEIELKGPGPLFEVLRYEEHREVQNKISSSVKAKIVLSAQDAL